ncbi:uncharacterized protein LOC144149380 [Haemaphysalis longicornis]
MASKRATVARRRNSGIPVPTPRTPETPPTPPPDEGHQPRRDGDTLFISFPAPQPFRCTETGCTSAYSAAAWTNRRQSLQRHLEGDHGMRIRRTVNLCALCGDTLGAKPTTHPCLANGRATAAPTQQRFQCTDCPSSFPSRKGLHNHTLWHKKEGAKRQRAASSQQSTTPGDDEGQNEGQPPTQATPASGGAASRQNSQAPSSPERGDGEESQQSTPRLTNTPLPQASRRSTPSQSDRSATPTQLFSQECPSMGGSPQADDDAGGEGGDEAVPAAALIDDSSVLAEHTKKLQRVLKLEPNEEAWDQFLEILDDALYHYTRW